MSEEIKIITWGDIFKNIETEEKAFKFKDYITSLQQKVEQLESIRKEAIQWIDEHDYYSGSSDIYYFSDFTPSNDLLNILNKGEKKWKNI